MKLLRLFMLAAGMSLLAGSAASGETVGAYTGAPSGTKPTALSSWEIARASRVGGNSNPALRYFSGKNVQPLSRSVMRAQVPLTRPVQVVTRNKPFSRVRRTSTISPYLNLDLPQTDVGLPNYYAFVQPMIMQQSTNQSQQKQFGRMEQQLRAVSTNGIIANNPSGGMPTTGHSTQFLNMGNYFPGR